MYESIISSYINKLTIEDISNYKNKVNITLSKDEEEVIYYFIKNNWQRIYQNDQEIWLSLKRKINEESYLKIRSLYIEMKKKYKF